MHYVISTFRRIGWLSPAFLFLVCCTLPVHAQKPVKLTEEHLRLHVRALDLNEREEETAGSIFDKYCDEIDALKDARKAIYQYLSDSYMSEEMYGPVPEEMDEDDLPIAELHNRAYKLIRQREGKLAVKAHASYFIELRREFKDRYETVDSLERAWHRELHFAGMREFGANIDLVKLVDNTINNVKLRKQLSGVLRDWEDQIDPLMLAYEKSEITALNRRYQAFNDIKQGKIDIDDAAKIQAELPLLRAKVLRLTEMTLGILLDDLPEQEAEILKKAWLEAKYPFIWKRTDETSLIHAALQNKNLPESTHLSLKNLQAEIGQLRISSSNRLDSLQRIKISEDSISQFYKSIFARYLDKELPYAEVKGDKKFTAEGRKFLDAMENIADRINSITNRNQ